MALLERQVIFKRKDKSGNTYMEFPVTRVDYVEGAVASVNGKLPDDSQNIQLNTLDTKSTNPITAVSNDTVAKWIELGAGEYFFNASYLNDQPTASGFLCNRVTGTNVFQLFKSQPSGALYYRDGNTTNGWTSSWVELLVEQYTLPTASASTLGGVKIGSNITNSSGVISLSKSNVTSALGYTPVKSINNKTADSSGNVDVVTALVDKIYPVGSIYMSTVATSPAELFGGTWEALDDGRVLIGANSTYTAGSTGGEASHTLTTAEMPSHTHTASTNSTGAHSHSRGTMNINGYVGGWYSGGQDDKVFTNSGTNYDSSTGSGTNYQWGRRYNFNANGNWTGSTNSTGAHSHTVTVDNTGSGTAHNNMQPYLAVYMWKRIA